MYDLIRRFRTGIVLALLVLIGFAMIFGERRGQSIYMSEGNALEAERPSTSMGGAITFQGTSALQELTHYSTAGIGDAWDRYVDLIHVKQENEQLRAERDRLREEHVRLLGVMQENARLRAMVGFQEAHPRLELVPAQVVALDATSFFRVTTVTLGVSDTRVQIGDPVVSSAGVVGHITELSGRYAEVMLTVDPRSSVDVVVQRNRARGVLSGLGNADDYAAQISYLQRREGADVGDIVVTSGMGGRYPPDLLVGRIVAVRDQNFGLFQDVLVEPTTDFARLEEVFIVVGEVR